MLEFYAKPFVIAVGKVNGRMMHAQGLIGLGHGDVPYPESMAQLTLKGIVRANRFEQECSIA